MRTHSLITILAAGVLVACQPKPAEVKPPTVGSFAASAASVAKGTRITLSWSVTGATAVAITDGRSGMAVPGVDNALEGMTSVEVQDSTVFVLVATSDKGQKSAATAPVTITGNPTDVTFGAFPAEIGPTESAVLAWSAPSATTVTITPEGGAALSLGTQLASGTVQVNPTGASTKYTLNASGTIKEATVKRRPAISELTLSRLSGQPGDMVTLSWRTTNATSVIVTASGRSMPVASITTAAMAAMGSAPDTIPSVPVGTVLTYTLEARGDGGSNTARVSFVVGNAPAITSFTVPPYAVIDAGFSISWAALNADVAEVAADGGATLFTSSTLGDVTDGGARLATPTTPTQLILTVRNTVTGDLARQARVVTPIGAVAASPTFTATPSTGVNAGGAVTLTWSASNARRVRVLENGELTVGYVEGSAAEAGSVTVYPNRASTLYTLLADNTVDAPVMATTSVTVTSPLSLATVDGGVVFDSATDVQLGWTVGSPNAQLLGLPHATVATTATFDDIATTGTALTFSSPNDAVQTVALPGFETFLYGARLPEKLAVSTNGWVRFTSSTSVTSAPTPPTTFPGTSTTYDNTLAPFWADLELGTGRVLWQVKGTAPKRKLIVQYDGVRLASQMTSTLTFQVQVSQSGELAFAYRTMTFTPPTAAPVAGLQGTGGQGALAALTGSNTGVGFFGPKSSPLTVPSAGSLPQSGFLEIAAGMMRVSTVTPLRAADIRITEVMFNPHPALTAGQWFEVTNKSATALSLAGWSVDFGSSTMTVPSGVVLPANGALVFGQSDAGTDNDGVAVDFAYGAASVMNRQAGALALAGPGVTARASWGASDAGEDAGGTVLVGGADGGQSAIFDSNTYVRSVDTGTAPLPSPRACLARTPFGTQTPQQLGSPGAASTCFVGYDMTAIPGRFTDISTTGTPLTFILSSGFGDPLDEGQVTVDVSSAPVRYAGAASNAVTVSTNGFVLPRDAGVFGSFTGNKTKPNTTSPPTGGSVIAPYWEDLDFGVNMGGAAYVKRMAMNEDPLSPAPHWVFQWSHTTYFINTDDLNFQIKWFDTGLIEFHYAQMTWETNANGTSATVWMEDGSGLNALAWSVNQPRVQPNSGIRFTPTN